MKKLVVLLSIFSGTAFAQDVYVLNVQPRMVTTYQQQCQQVPVQRQSGGNTSGGVLGAIAGAALGNQVGGGSGKDIATAAGAVIGYQMGRGTDQYGTVEYQTVCNNVPVITQRGEIVTFVYRGRRFTQVFE